ncbi:MAG: helix-turn-helix domain-containing protein [Bacteroidetes bacterium]|nr:helix-turn-helix domain-containing protein [Bacteroidota bacterium]
MENFEWELARDFIRNTSTAIYLTGKAGTGKTTFLKTVLPDCGKKYVVVAPTGVAAIHAGGMTIHSMFGLPTRAYIPVNDPVDPNMANNPSHLVTHFHYRSEKVKLLREMELLVLDEVSMVRADLMDEVDLALRYVRRSQLPYGGVQLLCIGDMYQLPPVVKDDEWALLGRYYDSPYFFDSLAFKQLDPVYVELKKIYRQSDRNFIRILNNIRHQDLQEEDYEDLKQCYNKDFVPDEPGFITLTTHNKKADAINERELQKLEGREHQLSAEIKGDFGENMFPTEQTLRLKTGAQVMFVKNDTSGERKFFNGKIGLVEKIDRDEGLTIRFPDTDETITVQKETWENIRYSVNDAEQKIEQNSVGSFIQYPVRLAWAITIHKSQGLTFQKAIIDAGESFAPGQVYVALSRCTSMEGMVLHSMVSNRNIICDPRIVRFSERNMKEGALENRLEADRRTFEYTRLMQLLSFQGLMSAVEDWEKKAIRISKKKETEVRRQGLLMDKALRKLQEVADRFHLQIKEYLQQSQNEQESMIWLKERVTRAIDYFSAELDKELTRPFQVWAKPHQGKSKAGKFYQCCSDMQLLLETKPVAMRTVSLNGEKLYTGIEPTVPEVSDKPEREAGSTLETTVKFFQEGMDAAGIAEARGLAVSTVEGHLARALLMGMIELEQLLPEAHISEIQSVLEKYPDEPLTVAKTHLPPEYSFGQIRYVQNFLKRVKINQSE